MAAARKAGEELREILRGEAARLGTVRALAAAIGITEGRLGKAMRGEFSLSVLSCLRLAKTSGKPPGQILRAAEKPEVDELIRELYAIGEATSSPSELELIRRFRQLPARHQAVARDTIAALSEGSSPAAAAESSRGRKRRQA